MKPVMVDAPVWRRSFSGVPSVLGALLDEDGAVLVHPFIVGELVIWHRRCPRERGLPRSDCLTAVAVLSA